MITKQYPVTLSCVLALAIAACGGGGGDDGDDDAPVCGNAMVEAGEQCDGIDLGDATCMSVTGRGGLLGCTADCTFDETGCTLASCGNGTVEDGEACDGDDLGGGTCESIGYGGGTIGCRADCVYNTAGCCTDTCPAEGDAMCIGDTLRACETAASGCLAWTITDCTATAEVCETSGAGAACVCVDRCPADGDQRCEGATIETCGLQTDGCLGWEAVTDCGASGQLCAMAPSGPICANTATAEDCADPYPLVAGENVVAWSAGVADYLTSQPSCGTGTLTGPDIVLTYTAPEDGFVNVLVDKPDAAARQVLVASSAACGAVEPELACSADTVSATMSIDLGVTAGTQYYLYVRDTTTNTAPLDNPLVVTVNEALCSSLDTSILGLLPPDGASLSTDTPILSADFEYPVDPTTGVITLTGSLGTDLAFDLATAPAEIALINSGRTLIIDPGFAFPSGEIVTVSWSGLVDATCGSVIDPPVWSFEITGPPCAPGVNGMVGTTITRIPLGVTSFTEAYVAADADPAGYVYVGGLSNLYRKPKAGGATEDVELAAGLATGQLGNDVLLIGSDVFSLESTTLATTSSLLWRISTNAGMTWAIENYLQLPQTANDELRSAAYHGGRIYMVTDETTAGAEIWSVEANASPLPGLGVLEVTLPGEAACTGIAVDSTYYYLACATGDRLIRVHRTTFAVDLLSTSYDLTTTRNALHVHDLDADGLADVLYIQYGIEEVSYLCAPSSTPPYAGGILVGYGGATSNFGLGFDPVAGVLWAYDDDTQELVRIE